MEDKTILISIKDMNKLGVTWSDYCDATGSNIYAMREGLSEDDMVNCPIDLIRKN